MTMLSKALVRTGTACTLSTAAPASVAQRFASQSARRMPVRFKSVRERRPRIPHRRTVSAFGVKRTCLFALQMSAFDPKRTLKS